MLDRLSRFTPLSGVAFAVLGVAAFGSSQPSPGARADGQRVIAFYTDHARGQQISDVLWALAFAVFVLFAATLREHIQRAGRAESLGALVIAGAAILCTGAATFFGADYVLAAVPASLTPGGAQALNVLAQNLFLAVSAGGLVFGLAAGVAILRSGRLPAWLGVAVIVIGIVAASPAGIFGLAALFPWAAIVSIVIFRRAPRPSAT